MNTKMKMAALALAALVGSAGLAQAAVLDQTQTLYVYKTSAIDRPSNCGLRGGNWINGFCVLPDRVVVERGIYPTRVYRTGFWRNGIWHTY